MAKTRRSATINKKGVSPMKIRFGLLLCVVLFLSGCASAPQQSLSLSPNAINSQAGRIGVAMTALPKQDTRMPGADCLFCIAAASIANSSLISHTKTLTYEDLPTLKNKVAALLRKKGANVTVIEENLAVKDLKDFSTKEQNFARKDFSPLRQKYNIDKLLVIDIAALGFVRNYSAYIPTSDPQAQLIGTGYLVNLENNAYELYQPVTITKSADQNWDEPPKFPGLTNAYFQTLEIGKDTFLEPFNNDMVANVAPAQSSLK
jgi:hypothetical protein